MFPAPEGGGGALDSHLDGGLALPLGGGGGENLTLSQTGAQKIHPVTIYRTKNFLMHTVIYPVLRTVRTDSLFCRVSWVFPQIKGPVVNTTIFELLRRIAT